MSRKHYPYHRTLESSLAKTDSPLVAMRLIRHVAFGLDISHTEVEIVLALAALTKPVPLSQVCAFISHTSKDRAKRLVNSLVKSKIVETALMIDAEGIHYLINPKVTLLIKSIDKSQLDSH